MRKIEKGAEPEALTEFKRKNPRAIYKDINDELRKSIREACVKEQFYLCAYCCKQITSSNLSSVNEHLKPRNTHQNLSLEFNNLVASCKTPKQCDAAHGSQELPLTPLMPACETDLIFKLSGRVEGKTPAAQETIKILNLGKNETSNRKLVEQRKNFLDAFLLKQGTNSFNLAIEDEEILILMLEELEQPVNGKLEPFAPVIANAIKQFVDK